MVSEIRLFATAQYAAQIQFYQELLASRGVTVEWVEIEQLNARFLRQHPELALCLDQDGLWLSAEGMKMQPDWRGEISRLKRASLKSELLARACQLAEKPKLIDATAGLGHDSLLMAHLGAEVILVERHPILVTLLEAAKAQATLDPFLADTAERISLVYADSQDYLEQRVREQQEVDVVYLDPMFPQRDQNSNKKQALVKKQMQLLHLLLADDGQMDLGEQLLAPARQIAKRVVVKRPRLAVHLDDVTPDHQWLGDACRFDAYFK
ncbi:class I SAM-dependent methyltransferase [Acinetobacter rudis]|uniref:Ribosomal RNA small subunit methyltransferase J n=1 Tax=Acinetobacter rudis TaxID=632955 RepID=A0AAW8JBI5_9GAMM|nr:class I SAM-dependent methyltransferase [Acinetobacter rudis]MDQ8936450.1 class I SAM-dependent methyltransferase [Acinetobacter rudis]MDQ8953902.1 class I SAM-dependent methyltransferase [Acinetobacter rudis]MDQ9018686.1 class I SAM-dependent methyltransferase [Acinetobacter rudis]